MNVAYYDVEACNAKTRLVSTHEETQTNFLAYTKIRNPTVNIIKQSLSSQRFFNFFRDFF